jgi:hypothetical protein
VNTATIIAQPLNKTTVADQQKPSIWRRMFDAWVRSYDARVSPDGTVLFIGL